MDLGRFAQLAPRGVGGDGMAFAAVDPERAQRRVELRVLVSGDDLAKRRRIEQRLRAAALLQHPAAMGVEELMLDHDPPFAVLPAVDGERLDLRINKRPPDLAKTWVWSAQIGAALVEAHRLGLAHGRLAPSCAVVGKHGDLVVDLLGLDFGVGAVKSLADASRVDRSAVAPERFGSPYTEMSMSQSSLGASLRHLKSGLPVAPLIDEASEHALRAEALVADQAADVFSLAAWWFLFWFREPLSVSVWHRLTTSKPRDALPEYPTDLAVGGPLFEPFADLLAEMLATDPTERPTAREALQRFEMTQPGLARLPVQATQPALTMETPPPMDATFDKVSVGASNGAAWPVEADEAESSPEQREVAEAATRFDVDRIAPRRTLKPGDTLGRFQILSKLGEGGMGAVYKARDPLGNREVAVKLLASHLARSEAARRRFTKEARLLAAVNNPYVANLYEFNQDGDSHYLVLEYVRGRSVDKYLAEKGAVREEIAVSIAADVARALIDAHRRGIVHRDVKPENILLVDTLEPEFASPSEEASLSPAPIPQAKLTDFGIAGVRDASESMAITQAGAMLGTPLYMAPETWEKGANVDAASDVYALGATLFHLLVGRPPYDGTDPVALMKQHCLEETPSPRAAKPELSEVVDGIVRRAMAKVPAERFPDAESMLDALERHLRGEPTTALGHPRLPDDDSQALYDVTFKWDLESPPEKLWPLVSNTDRVNHAIGLQAPEWEYVTKGATRQRYASMSLTGVKLRWLEHPFEWLENRRLSVLREFETGPFEWFVSTVDLIPRPEGGTRLEHRVRVRPRGLFGRLLAMFEIGWNTKRKMTRLYVGLDEGLQRSKDAEWTDAFVGPTPLPTLFAVRLKERMAALREQGVDAAAASALEEYLKQAPDQSVSRMRPWGVADELGVDRNAMLTTLLHASRVGLVKMMWDVLCPVCRIPSESHDSLSLLREHGHCDVCRIDYDLDFGKSIELFFRGHPEIRDAEPKTYCIGGPAFSPHVVAQVRLAPQERFELSLQLEPGDFILRGPELPYQVEFVVDPRAAVTRWDHPVGLRPSLTEELRFGPERQTFVLRNTQPHEVIVRIERTASRSDAVTAAFASAYGPFREIMPREILAAGRAGAVPTVTILFAAVHQAEALYAQLGDAGAFDVLHRAFQMMDREVRKAEGALVKTIGGGVLAVFPQLDPALACATAMARELPTLPGQKLALQACIHRGPAMLTTINQRLDYFGSAVNVVSTLVRAAGPGEAILTSPVFSDPSVRKTLAASGAAAGANTSLSAGRGFLRAKLPNGASVLVQRIKLEEPASEPAVRIVASAEPVVSS